MTTDTLVPILALWIIFDVLRALWGWLKKPKPAPPATLPPDYWTQFDKHVEDKVFDCMIAANEAQANELMPVPAPVAVANNGHHEEPEDIESLTAPYRAAQGLQEHVSERVAESPPVTVTNAPKDSKPVPAKKEKRGWPKGKRRKQ